MRRALLLGLLALLSACGHFTRQEAEPASAAPQHETLSAGVERLVQPVLAPHAAPIIAAARPDRPQATATP